MLLLGLLLVYNDQTGCKHLGESSLNWQSLFTELSTALHLGICLICCAALLTSHQDAVAASPVGNLL